MSASRYILLALLGSVAGFAIADPAPVSVQAPGPNTEPETGPVPQATGFSISINGAPVTGDPQVEDLARQADLALEDADVQVKYDGLDIRPRLDIEFIGDSGFEAGETVRIQSAVNYPAFIARAELRVIDPFAVGGPRILSVIPVEPNGQATLVMPEGEGLVVTHRVYDRQGRFDETHPLSLARQDPRITIDGVEEGRDRTARRRIPLGGGSVTIFAENLPAGAQVTALGETLRADPDGKVIVQRILPVGTHQAQIQAPGVDLVREIEIPRSDWFYVGTADLTFGRRSGDLYGSETYRRGRLSFYIDGKRATGTRITASLDTGEEDLSDVFRRLDERDPRNTLRRVDPNDLYPTFGDDSTLEEGAPTSGRLYLRVERDGNFFTWGDTQADLDGGTYLRNERRLYGASAYWALPEQTSFGEPRLSFSGYAAQSDQISQRDVFQATGGSVYFLRQQDISIATETLTLQIRDATTGRVLETRRLEPGRDYDINYIQGVVTLSGPLSAAQGSSGVVITDPGGDTELALIAQYEFTPTSTDIDSFAFGGRVEGWVTDRLRLGATVMSEETELDDQRAYGVDLRYRISDESYAALDYAQSAGPGRAASLSSDGGLIFDSEQAAEGDGSAVRGDIQLSLADLGLAAEGRVGAYAERRSEGFSTLDYQVTDATGDERLWGVYGDIQTAEKLRWILTFDSYDNDAGEFDRTGEVAVEYAASDRLTYALGLEHVDRNRGANDLGQRTDLGLRVTHTPSERLEYYLFGQATLSRDGLPRNSRLGLGGSYKLSDLWTVSGEISDGSLGVGGRVLAQYDTGEGNSFYAGYELEPGRDIAGVDLLGSDGGRFILGATRQINDRITTFGENIYDIFGDRQSLTTAYGVTYEVREDLSFTGAIEAATVSDQINGDFDRYALSLGVQKQTETFTGTARFEYRRDTGEINGTSRDGTTLLFSGDMGYKLDDAQRILASLEASGSNSDGLLSEGDFVDFSLGYAFRPVKNDRFNMLLRYRFLYDTFGQLIDSSEESGEIQRSHVFSIDGIYELNDQWEIGAKLGGRLTDSAPDQDTALTENDAILAIANARWHVTHKWDALLELRSLHLLSSDIRETGFVGVIYRHIGDNVKLGIGHNFTSFSDDLTDLRLDDRGLFINLVAKF